MILSVPGGCCVFKFPRGEMELGICWDLNIGTDHFLSEKPLLPCQPLPVTPSGFLPRTHSPRLFPQSSLACHILLYKTMDGRLLYGLFKILLLRGCRSAQSQAPKSTRASSITMEPPIHPTYKNWLCKGNHHLNAKNKRCKLISGGDEPPCWRDKRGNRPVTLCGLRTFRINQGA